MAIYEFEGMKPKIGEGCYIFESADLLGDVTIGDNVSVWNNAVIRGDIGAITIGSDTSIQDLCMLHITEGNPLEVGSQVTVGHSATLHSCTIGNNCLIGMGSTILDDAEIGEGSLVAAGSLVTPGKKFPPKSFIKGSPAKFVRELSPDEIEGYSNHYKHYLKIKERFIQNSPTRI